MITLIRNFLLRGFLSVLTFFCISLLTNSLFAQDLFRQLELETVKLSSSQAKVLDFLQQSETTIGLRLVEVNIDDLLNKQSINLNLIPGKNFVALKERINTRTGIDFDWHGSILGKSNNFVLSVYQDAVTGSVSIENEVYDLWPLGNGIHAIVHIDASKYPQCGNIPIQNERNVSKIDQRKLLSSNQQTFPQKELFESKEPSIGLLSTQDTIIKVLVAYTPAARSEAASSVGIDAVINNAIAAANVSYSLSGIPIELELAHKVEVNYTETIASSLEWCNEYSFRRLALTEFADPSDGEMDSIHILRDAFGADVAVLIAGSIVGDAGQAFDIGLGPNEAFCIVRHDFAAKNKSWSFAHEIGHLLGARHETDEAGGSCNHPFSYGHAYAPAGVNWTTMMGIKPSRDRIKKWSSPNVYNEGVPTGDVLLRDNVTGT